MEISNISQGGVGVDFSQGRRPRGVPTPIPPIFQPYITGVWSCFYAMVRTTGPPESLIHDMTNPLYRKADVKIFLSLHF